MYEEIMLDVHRQWRQEFDREQAVRRLLPRRERAEGAGILGILRRRRRPAPTRALACGYPQAQQCAL